MVKAIEAGAGIRSMTGFAASRGQGAQGGAWELRSVNGRGFDLRLRLPEGIDGLEPGVRALIGAAVARGSVTLSLRLDRAPGAAAIQRIDEAALDAMLAALVRVQAAAKARGLSLAPVSAADILTLRGVLDAGAADAPDAESQAGAQAVALLADLPALVADFDTMRRHEGAALAALIAAQVDHVASLTEAAEAALAPRHERLRATLTEAVARLSPLAATADPTRLEQELAILATKSDVTEELDRLRAHVEAGRALLGQGGPVGRKLDFLTQEFNREANTLCAKSQSLALTRIGLDLKAVIDQMREQVQNVE